MGQIRRGVQVISPKELARNCADYLVIIGSRKYKEEMRARLLDVRFPTKNVFISAYDLSVVHCGKQYFDMFEPGEKEVFVDAGAYNGDTIDNFLTWVGNGEYKIYAIEPLKDMCDEIKDKKIPNVEILNCAAWNKKAKVSFVSNMRGSAVGKEDTESMLWGRKIDEIVGGDRVSLIKMDIEGAELKALEGARETILKYLPRLAISIYHKYEDIYEIGSYILGLNPNYKLYIRHYTTCSFETVLYAVG